QFGAVGRQEVQAEIGDLLDAPFQMQFRAMILGIVADGHHAAAGDRACRSEYLEEFPEALTIESSALATKQELAVSQAHGSEVSDALACGGDGKPQDLWSLEGPTYGTAILAVVEWTPFLRQPVNL